MGYFPFRYNSRVVFYKHKMFIRLTTGPNCNLRSQRLYQIDPWHNLAQFCFCQKLFLLPQLISCTDILLPNSVTRWLDYLLKLGRLQQSKLPKWPKAGSNFCSALNKPSHYHQRLLKYCQNANFSPNLVTLLPNLIIFLRHDTNTKERKSFSIFFFLCGAIFARTKNCKIFPFLRRNCASIHNVVLIPGIFLFIFFSTKTLNYLQVIVKNVHPVYRTGIQTHNLQNMCL